MRVFSSRTTATQPLFPTSALLLVRLWFLWERIISATRLQREATAGLPAAVPAASSTTPPAEGRREHYYRSRRILAHGAVRYPLTVLQIGISIPIRRPTSPFPTSMTFILSPRMSSLMYLVSALLHPLTTRALVAYLLELPFMTCSGSIRLYPLTAAI